MTEPAPAPSQPLTRRVRAAWSALDREQRLAAIGAGGLIGSMFLPWYQQTGFSVVRGGSQEKVEDSLIAFQAWSFVEASILLVALAVLALLFARAERRAFHLPGGDGLVLLGAGAWVMFLVFFRQIDKPGGNESGVMKVTVGVSWGIFVAFLFGALIAYAGVRIRASARPEPPRDGVRPRVPVPPPADPRTTRMAVPDAATTRVPTPEPPTTRVATPEPPTTRVATPAAPRPRANRPGDGPLEGQLSFEDPGDAPSE